MLSLFENIQIRIKSEQVSKCSTILRFLELESPIIKHIQVRTNYTYNAYVIICNNALVLGF